MLSRNRISRRLFSAALVLGTLCSLPTNAHATGETFSFAFQSEDLFSGAVSIFGQVSTDGSTDLSTTTVEFEESVSGFASCDEDGWYSYSGAADSGSAIAILKDDQGVELARYTFTL